MLNIVVELLFVKDGDRCCINDGASLNFTGSKHPTPCTRELFSHESALPFKSDFKTMEMAGAGGGKEKIFTSTEESGMCSAVNRAKVPADYVTARISKILQHVYDVPDS